MSVNVNDSPGTPPTPPPVPPDQVGCRCDQCVDARELRYLRSRLQESCETALRAQARRDELERQLRAVQQDNIRLGQEPTGLQKKVRAAEDERDTLKGRVVALEQHVHELKAAVRQKELEVEDLAEELADLKEENGRAQAPSALFAEGCQLEVRPRLVEVQAGNPASFYARYERPHFVRLTF